MPIEESAVAAQIFLRLLMALFALGVFGGIITNALIIWRTKSLVTPPGRGAYLGGSARDASLVVPTTSSLTFDSNV